MVLVSTAVAPVDARAWDTWRQGQYAGIRGAGTFQRQGSWRPGMLWRQTRWQGPRGAGWGQINRNWDTGQGYGYGERRIQLPNGQTAKSTRQVVRNPDGSYTVTGNGFNGQPVSGWVSPYDGGRWQGTSRTLANGVQVQTGRWMTGNPQSGYTRSGGYQTSDGRSGTVSGQLTPTGNGYTRQNTAVNQVGSTVTRSIDVQRNDGATTRDVTVTGPGGNGWSYSTGVSGGGG